METAGIKNWLVTAIVVGLFAVMGLLTGMYIPEMYAVHSLLKLELFAAIFTIVALTAYLGLGSKEASYRYTYACSVLTVNGLCFLLSD